MFRKYDLHLNTNNRIVYALFTLNAAAFLISISGCYKPVSDADISDLDSKYPTFRAVALHRTAQSGDMEHLARQVELLSDEDPAVRFYAIMSLKKLTGTDNGYDYRNSPSLRQQAIDRWEKWLENNSCFKQNLEGYER